MQKYNMVVTTAATIALMMEWVVPDMIADLHKVCINSGKMDDLMSLTGVGPIVAKKIIAYRKLNGPFQTPEDIMKVKGVGTKLFEINQEDIVVENFSSSDLI